MTAYVPFSLFTSHQPAEVVESTVKASSIDQMVMGGLIAVLAVVIIGKVLVNVYKYYRKK